MAKIRCTFCNSDHTQKDGQHKDMQRYRCMNCGKRFLSGAYDGNFTYITHFNTKIKKTDRNILTRENYCVPSREVDYKTKRTLEEVKHFFEAKGRYPLLTPICYRAIPNNVFSDYEHFTEEFVNKHYQDCMRNFDLNMTFFRGLDFVKFNRHLMSFVKKNKFKEIFDLKEADGISGIYILVLDKYKQVYIGKSASAKGIKSRILSHWSGKKEFSRLLFGTVENSILPIEVFGALDTTRIYVRVYRWSCNLDETERKLIERFDARYRLNRVAGGINAEDDDALRNLQLLNSRQIRSLDANSNK